MSPFTERVIETISQIPYGRVISYGHIAALAGNPKGARQVVRILNMNRGKNLPWYRIVAKDGRIALPEGEGRELQMALLAEEGITVRDGRVDMETFGIQA